jgi:hypothetical protein
MQSSAADHGNLQPPRRVIPPPPLSTRTVMLEPVLVEVFSDYV